MTESMNDYTERVKAERGEVVPAEPTASEVQRLHKAAVREEGETVDLLRGNARRAAEIEADMLERISTVHGRDLPQALKAVNSVKTNSIDALLKLTGRVPVESESDSIASLLTAMANKGYARLNVSLEPGEGNG